MILSGGPDREQAISLQSGAAVDRALREAGHQTKHCQIGPNQLEAIDQWRQWNGHVVFPVLHGPWGEGGSLQAILDEQNIPYVGCRADAAGLCMDKYRTKKALTKYNLITPQFELVTQGQEPTLAPPIVIKPPREGSSIDLSICHDLDQVRQTLSLLSHHPALLVERYIQGMEFTVGVITSNQGDLQALPPIRIIPKRDFYDFQAKYERDDTEYVLDPRKIALPAATLAQLGHWAVRAHQVLGCRHMSRTDFMVDHQLQPWILEINTVPGFTSHSLLPKAAAHAGLPLRDLVDRLVRLAAEHPDPF